MVSGVRGVAPSCRTPLALKARRLGAENPLSIHQPILLRIAPPSEPPGPSKTAPREAYRLVSRSALERIDGATPSSKLIPTHVPVVTMRVALELRVAPY